MTYNQPSENERHQIYCLKKSGYSQMEIAELLARIFHKALSHEERSIFFYR